MKFHERKPLAAGGGGGGGVDTNDNHNDQVACSATYVARTAISNMSVLQTLMGQLEGWGAGP